MSGSQVEALMGLVQVYASAYSLIGGRFDKGGQLAEADEAKDELRKALIAALDNPLEADLQRLFAALHGRDPAPGEAGPTVIGAAAEKINEQRELIAAGIDFRIVGGEDPIMVSSRGDGKWAVAAGRSVLNLLGEWEWEPMPSSRTDEFKARTRFSFEEAVTLAKTATRDGPLA